MHRHRVLPNLHPLNSPSLTSVTVFLLEVSLNPFTIAAFPPIDRIIHLDLPLVDSKRETFFSDKANDITVVGFVLFFSNNPTFLTKSGFHVEDLFARDCHMRKEFGRMLLFAVAKQMHDWNLNAIKVYEEMAKWVLRFTTIVEFARLTGEALQAYGD
ncbi:hypothetical protein Ddye_028830 [Dipteronia dyeriana]|uniref:Uncharacterized protein n=1 Tax=Dipteronia dyeriana TaxID=168575 RepID=A0AAD9WL69_9ROSI|nr:hypothetical protein Ddye_028830 [Dipteronia dyeriana]